MTHNRINTLQVYRGIAAIMVVFFHITVFARERFAADFLGRSLSFGYVGVDFFFVLSGFIIYFVNWKDMGQPSALGPYLVKRCLRVYPIYWIVTSLKIAVLVVMPSLAKAYETNPMVILKSYLLFPQQSNLPIIGAAWTLSYEVMFYLLFAIGIGFGIFWFRRILGMWIGGIVALAAARALMGSHFQSHYLLDFLLNERNLEFLLGCLSAYLILNHRLRYRMWWVVAGVVMFGLSALFVNSGGIVGSHTLLFGLPSFLIVTGSAAAELKKPLRPPRLLIFLGDASYSIYLTHALFINICALALTRLDLVNRLGLTVPLVLTALLSIGGGCVIYVLVEKPLLGLLSKHVMPAKMSVRTAS